MVERSFLAIDNENLVVTSSSSSAIVGNGIINNSNTPNGTTFTYSTGTGEIITLDDTGGDADVFEDDNAAAHVIVDGAGLVATGQTVEAESFIMVRALDASGNQTGDVITITVFSQGGSFSDVWGLSSDLPLEDGTSYVKISGSNQGSASYTDFATCFLQGTLIDTPSGARKIEDLQSGDLVNTRDCGPQPLRWKGAANVLGRGAFAPIRIEAGALGNTQTLFVSQEHRMSVNDPAVEVLFGMSSALIAAKFLVGLDGVTQTDMAQITYHHLLFDTHQILRSAGCWSESFFLASNSVAALEADAQREITALFPEMTQAQGGFEETAETVLKRHEAKLLVDTLTQLSNHAAA
ncbi:MAG: Hint domain-containing protein [Sulfitobacter sp.]